MGTSNLWPDEHIIRIGEFTFDEYVERVRAFHGFEAPGVLIGGFMVDRARGLLPEGKVFDALCETSKCLPDAIQLLTPCTTGNNRLIVINIGRFAFTLFDKETGEGIRVFIDPSKISSWPELDAWFFNKKTKKEQDFQRLLDEIKRAKADICGIQRVQVDSRFYGKNRRGPIGICPHCREAYPVNDGEICLACQGTKMHDLRTE